MITISREELAWAAGFFDGEGNFYVKENSHGSLNFTQCDPQVLVRFQKAVGDLGIVYGPYDRRRNNNQNLRWEYRCQSFQGIQAVVAMLWVFLSPVKREQCFKALMSMKG